MTASTKTGLLGRIGFAHSYLFTSFPPYRFASIATPVLFVLAAFGFWLMPHANQSSNAGNAPQPGPVSVADEQVCISNDDPNEIIAACSRLIEGGGQSPHDTGVDYYHRGRAYLAENQFGPAITDLTQAIQLIPNDADAYVDRSDAEGNEGDLQDVIRDTTAALQIIPQDTDAMLNQGRAYLQEGSYDQAVRSLTNAINLSPSANAYSTRGQAYGEERQYAASVQDYDQAIRLNPADESSYEARGASEYNEGDYTTALNDEKTALQMKPGDTNAQNVLQMAEGKIGQ